MASINQRRNQMAAASAKYQLSSWRISLGNISVSGSLGIYHHRRKLSLSIVAQMSAAA